uniref:Large ribosomal subunit protein bL20c n=1 Tax=Lepocinclis ovum TaxID=86638 RepID=A0A3G3LM15_9EUGL|nr:ribosomal protein L20 [Lepocinclis ovum]AYQ93756.1 ribosomal protein L20 [Lepocinclis ovum]
MSRTKTGFVTRKRHKKIIRFNKGYRGSHSTLFKTANQENMRSFVNSYRDRKKKKNYIRSLWIKQLNNIAKINSIKYNTLIRNLKKSSIELNRKMLSKLAIIDKNIFLNFIKLT